MNYQAEHDTDAFGQFGPLAVSSRNGFNESFHFGAAVTLSAEGHVVASVGNPDTVVFARSCLKPLQADAMVKLGLKLPDELLALVCASHDGDRDHTEAAQHVLALHNLPIEALQTPKAHPTGADARRRSMARSTGGSRLEHNCSGKHAGMLATCVINEWPTSSYLNPDHPLQQAIGSHVGELLTLSDQPERSIVHVGIDGCGAPTFATPLRNLAGAVARLQKTASPTLRAMSANPTRIGGTQRDVSQWMTQLPNVVVKDGAAGVMVGVAPNGRAFAFKVSDGSDRARQAVGRVAIDTLTGGQPSDDVGREPDASTPGTVAILGGGQPVGHVHPLPWTTAPGHEPAVPNQPSK